MRLAVQLVHQVLDYTRPIVIPQVSHEHVDVEVLALEQAQQRTFVGLRSLFEVDLAAACDGVDHRVLRTYHVLIELFNNLLVLSIEMLRDIVEFEVAI